MSSGLQSAEVSGPASSVPGSTESANTHCPGNGVVKALSTAPIISIVDANTRMSTALSLCHANDPTLAAPSLRRVADRQRCAAAPSCYLNPPAKALAQPYNACQFQRTLPTR